MARSRKKVFGPTWNPRTHREWKSLANRRARRYYKTRAFLYDEDYVFPTLREVANVWSSPRDGRWFGYPELTLRELKETWWAKDKWWRYVNK